MRFKMNNKTTISIITILLLITIGYIVFEKSGEYLQGERLLYYNQGYENGARYWNNQVIETANSEGKIPFIVNNSVQTINIKELINIEELCER